MPVPAEVDLKEMVLRAGYLAGLLFLLAVLYFVIARNDIDYPGSYLAALGVFVIKQLDDRVTQLHVHDPRLGTLDADNLGKRRVKRTVQYFFHSHNIAVK